jgi:hypothetical protein
MNPRKKTRDRKALGFTLTCTVRKATRTTLRIGTLEPASRSAGSRLMRVGQYRQGSAGLEAICPEQANFS